MKDSIYCASPADVLHEIAVGSTAASSRNIYTISQWSHMKERNAWHSWHCLFSGPCSKIRSWDRNRLSLDGPVRTRSFKYSEHFCGPSNTSCWGILWNIILPFVFLVCASFCVEALFKSNIQVSLWCPPNGEKGWDRLNLLTGDICWIIRLVCMCDRRMDSLMRTDVLQATLKLLRHLSSNGQQIK